MNHKGIINEYIMYRLDNNVNEILNLLDDKCTLISKDGIHYTGKANLRDYYSVPQNVNLIRSHIFEENNENYIDLSFYFLNTTRLYFTFNNENKIIKIRIKDIDLTKNFIGYCKTSFKQFLINIK